jgi:hypothetical protein
MVTSCGNPAPPPPQGQKKERKKADLVERDPMLHSVTEPLEQDSGIREIVLDNLHSVRPSTIAVFEGGGSVPVEDRHPRCQTSRDTVINL